MFTILYRVLFVAGFLLLLVLLKSKRSIPHRFLCIRCLSFGLLVVLALMILRPDKQFLTFPTPQSAFEYEENATVIGTVDGKVSSCVLGVDKTSSHRVMLTLKTSVGYKLGPLFATTNRIDTNVNSNSLSVKIFSDPSGTDFYIRIMGFVDDENWSVHDNCASFFFWDESYQDDPDYPKPVFGIAYIKDYGDSYRLEIFNNGEHTVLDDQLVELE